MSSQNNYPLTLEEFKSIYSKVPRIAVEIVVVSEAGILLTKRAIEPAKGSWHIPGGTVYMGEKLKDAVIRVTNKELGINVLKSKLIGYIEYLDSYEKGIGYPIGMAFMVEYEGEIKLDEEASEAKYFKELPENMPIDQTTFINKKVFNR